MTNTIEPPTSELPPPVPPAPVPTAPLPPAPPPRRRSAGHIVAIVAGVFLLLPGIGMFFGGGAVTLASSVADDGYFSVTLDRLETDGVAIATVDLWDQTGEDDEWPWVLDWLDLDVRIRADGARASDEIFVGIARTDDVEDYLTGATYSDLIEIDHRSPRYDERTGDRTVAAPDTQDFWTASVSGDGEQELEWRARGGRWSVVLMNADGSPDVAADVQVGVHSDAVLPIGITLLVIGGLLTIGAVTLIVIGARGRRD